MNIKNKNEEIMSSNIVYAITIRLTIENYIADTYQRLNMLILY